ncbi:MAG TPA: 2-phosphosulfolactate phosphatase [Aliidongia sp.]|nr:2-phosphosulfolactate phosphatase [Aliidongia sp.]
MISAACEWGLAGIAALRDRVSVFVIVDVLSFSTAVDVALARGAVIYPVPDEDTAEAGRTASRLGAMLAQKRRVAAPGQFSLSPASLLGVPPGLKLVLPSPNGARLSLAGGDRPVLAGCLRNAAAVARAARDLAGTGMVAVIPAGERWPGGSLRPAIEDLLGAGAILHHLDRPCSPEAQIARDAYRSAGTELAALIRGSVSGRELIERGFPRDVELATAEEVSGQAPLLIEGAYRAG